MNRMKPMLEGVKNLEELRLNEWTMEEWTIETKTQSMVNASATKSGNSIVETVFCSSRLKFFWNVMN